MTRLGTELSKLHKNETLKVNSNYLRGMIKEGLEDMSTGSIKSEDTQLTKFHGLYQQDNRDIRPERRKKKLEAAHAFMVRLRIPGGVLTSDQYLQLNRIVEQRANGTLRLTTRQTFQLHGVIKTNLKPAIQEINQTMLDTIAACGDNNRGVMGCPNPIETDKHPEILELACALSDHLTPRTRAYHEIWLDEEPVASSQPDNESEAEPIYGKQYLPRKFKIGIAVPPSNDVDVFTQDLGLIAIIENGRVVGYNVSVGGGQGMTHGKENTFPRNGDIIGFCTPDQVLDIAEKVVTTQRDYGNRADRTRARMKYTIEDMGLENFHKELESRLGFHLQEARPYVFTSRGDRYGWCEGAKGNWHYTVFVQNGRIKDTDALPLKSGLAEIAKVHKGHFRCTANQNIMIADVPESEKDTIQRLLDQYHLVDTKQKSGLRLNAMSCVALPTCGLAMAESERYLPDLVTEIEKILQDEGLGEDAITIRMTGCPNGCARPYVAEIAFVGKGPRTYNLYLGGGFLGERLNKLYKADVKDNEIVGILQPIIEDYAKNRINGEAFGDFVIRAGYVHETTAGNQFHEQVGALK